MHDSLNAAILLNDQLKGSQLAGGRASWLQYRHGQQTVEAMHENTPGYSTSMERF